MRRGGAVEQRPRADLRRLVGGLRAGVGAQRSGPRGEHQNGTKASSREVPRTSLRKFREVRPQVTGEGPVLGSSWAGAVVDVFDTDGDAVYATSKALDASLTKDVYARSPSLWKGGSPRRRGERGVATAPRTRRDVVPVGSRAAVDAADAPRRRRKTQAATCATTWADARVHIYCDVPDVPTAGVWDLTVTLGGVVVALGNQTIKVRCPVGKYQGPNEVCIRCTDAAVCEEEGIDLAALELAPGRWRASETSTRLRSCLRADACPGGAFVGDAACADGYEGPLCGVCAEGYTSAGRYGCEPCADASVVMGVVNTCFLLVALAVVGYLGYFHRARLEALALGDMTPRRGGRVLLRPCGSSPLETVETAAANPRGASRLTPRGVRSRASNLRDAERSQALQFAQGQGQSPLRHAADSHRRARAAAVGRAPGDYRRAEILSVGLDFAMAFKKTTRVVQRGKNQQARCSYGRDRVAVRR